jgi:hypothetical protein
VEDAVQKTDEGECKMSGGEVGENIPTDTPIDSPEGDFSWHNAARVATMQKSKKAAQPAWIKGFSRKMTPVVKLENWRRGGDSKVACIAIKLLMVNALQMAA